MAKIDGRFDKATEYVMQIKGQDSSPQNFDSERVIPNYDVGQGGFNRLHEGIKIVVRDLQIGGSATSNNIILGQEGRTYGGITPFATYSRDKNVYLHWCYMNFYCNNDAAAIALNGQYISYGIRMYIERSLSSGGGIDIVQINMKDDPIYAPAGPTSRQIYHSDFKVPTWLPSGGAIGSVAFLQRGGAWPGAAADYGMNCRLAYVELPVGVQMPV